MSIDGLCRLPRIAEAAYTQNDLSVDKNSAHYFPVTVIEGMTHMQFSSGEVPEFVFLRDLLPEISYDSAHEQVAYDVTAFVNGLLDKAWNAMDARLEKSRNLMQPIIDALLQEGYHQFKPPCYCEEVSRCCSQARSMG